MPSKRDSIVWLHLSDAHLCPSKTGWDADRILESLRDDFRTMQGDFDLHPDLIFFTGDLVYGNLHDAPIGPQFEQAESFLNGVRKAFKPAIPINRVYIVPVNHDTDRLAVAESETYWLDSLPAREKESAPEIVNKLIRDGGKQWQRYMERLDAFREFLQKAGYTHLLQDPRRLISSNVHSIAGIKVGIAGLNSVWSCCREEEKGKLWLGRWQIGHLYNKLKAAHIRLALSHQPFNWFTAYEDPALWRELEQTFSFHLHGHEHQGWVNAGSQHIRIAGGACYDSSLKENGYNFTRILPSPGKVEIFLRRYDKDGGGWVPRIIHDKTDINGRWLVEDAEWLKPGSKVGAQHTKALPLPSVPKPNAVVLAVLPLRHSPGGALDDFLVSGFCDDIVSRLSKLGTLRIISSESTMAVQDLTAPVSEIGGKLGADTVLTGALREFSDVLHLNVNLIDTRSSVTLWSEAYNFGYGELADAQIKVAMSVADALKVKLSSSEEADLRRRYTDSVEAYELYLRGIGLVSTNREQDVSVALSMFDRAASLDRKFSDALAFKGYALWRKYFAGWGGDINTLHTALECTEEAMRLDPASATASMAFIRICWDLGWHEKGLAEGQRAAKNNPGSVDAILAMARAYNNAGMADKSIPLASQVLLLDPTSPTAKKLLIWNHVMVGSYERACDLAQKYLERNPEDSNTVWAVVMANMQTGDLSNAIRIANDGLEADSSNYTLWQLLGYAHRMSKDVEAAIRVWKGGISAVQALLEGFPTNYRARAWLANLYGAIGDKKSAVNEIETVREAEPTNSYLLYRLGNAYSEIGDIDKALELLKHSIDNGFLSVQIMRCEELAALKNLTSMHRYKLLKRELHQHVESLKGRY